MRGTVIFTHAFIGTKSESIRPYLYVGNAKLIMLYVTGDNPFENESLRPFDGMTVDIPEPTPERIAEDGTLVLSSRDEIHPAESCEPHSDGEAKCPAAESAADQPVRAEATATENEAAAEDEAAVLDVEPAATESEAATEDEAAVPEAEVTAEPEAGDVAPADDALCDTETAPTEEKNTDIDQNKEKEL